METVTVTFTDNRARRLLEELERLGILKMEASNEPIAPRKRTFTALSYSTKGFKFNREEANER